MVSSNKAGRQAECQYLTALRANQPHHTGSNIRTIAAVRLKRRAGGLSIALPCQCKLHYGAANCTMLLICSPSMLHFDPSQPGNPAWLMS